MEVTNKLLPEIIEHIGIWVVVRIWTVATNPWSRLNCWPALTRFWNLLLNWYLKQQYTHYSIVVTVVDISKVMLKWFQKSGELIKGVSRRIVLLPLWCLLRLGSPSSSLPLKIAQKTPVITVMRSLLIFFLQASRKLVCRIYTQDCNELSQVNLKDSYQGFHWNYYV